MDNEKKDDILDISITDLDDGEKNKNSELLDISFDSLNDDSSDILTIDKDDLEEVYDKKNDSKIGKKDYKKPSQLAVAMKKSPIYTFLFGAFGGGLAWVLSYIFRIDYLVYTHPWELIVQMGLFTGIIGISIAFFINAAEKVIMGNFKLAFVNGFKGSVYGVIGGILGGGIAQIIFGYFTMNYTLSLLSIILLRATVWSFFGLFIGASVGLISGSYLKTRYTLLGGVLGGFLGGALFEIIAQHTMSSLLPRFVGFLIVGGLIGVSISLIEEFNKKAWLKIIAGPLKGKSFILYNETTKIGKSAKCDIVLVKNKDIGDVQAEIKKANDGFRLKNLNRAETISVNDRNKNTVLLTNKDKIGIGNTFFIFEYLKK